MLETLKLMEGRSVEPRYKKCDSCGAVNELISLGGSRRCINCDGGMDWTLDIKCRNCRRMNKIRPNGVKEAKCQSCAKPLMWTLHPELYVKKRLPLAARLLAVALILWILIVVLKALHYQHLEMFYLRKRDSSWYAFSGVEMRWPISALLIWMAGLVALIANHYDRRFNEKTYGRVMKVSAALGLILLIVSSSFGTRLT